MSIIVWLLIGLAAGALARLILPGRDPMGLLATIVLGLAGAVLGGFLSRALLHDADGVGLFGATVGAIIVLLVWRWIVGTRRRGVRGFGRRVVS